MKRLLIVEDLIDRDILSRGDAEKLSDFKEGDEIVFTSKSTTWLGADGCLRRGLGLVFKEVTK